MLRYLPITATSLAILLAADLAQAQQEDSTPEAVMTYSDDPASAKMLKLEKEVMPFVEKYYEPTTVIKILSAIVTLVQQGREDDAEAAFRQEVIFGLHSILYAIGAVQQQITELGVRLQAAIEDVPLRIAEGELQGALIAVHGAYPDLSRPNQQGRATELFDELNASTGEAAVYGPALLPVVAAGILTLERLRQYTRQSEESRRATFGQYVPILAAWLSPDQDRSLIAQQAQLIQMIGGLETNINSFLQPPQRIGTHDYGRTWDIENVRRNDAGWFEYWLTYEKKPEPPRGDRTHSGERGPRFMIEDLKRSESSTERMQAIVEAFFVLDENPIAASEVILYTTGVRSVLTQAQLSASHSGDDQHPDEWVGHVASHAAGANMSVGLQRHIAARIAALQESVELAKRTLELTQRLAR